MKPIDFKRNNLIFEFIKNDVKCLFLLFGRKPRQKGHDFEPALNMKLMLSASTIPGIPVYAAYRQAGDR